jgi:hypothetical protein
MRHGLHASYALAARSLSVFMYKQSCMAGVFGSALQVFFRAKYANLRAITSEEDLFCRLLLVIHGMRTRASACENTLSARVMS